MRISQFLVLLTQTIFRLVAVKKSIVGAITAAPFTFRHTQPDGTQTPELLLHGDEAFNYLTDEKGYTVVRSFSGWDVYATKDPLTGELMPTEFVVGQVDPLTVPELKRGETPRRSRLLENETKKDSALECGKDIECLYRRHRRIQSTPVVAIAEAAAAYSNGSLKHLVVLMKFSDHSQRALPPRESYDILFNKEGGDPLIAPTGSVRDIYTQSSYGKLIIDSTVLSWLTLPETEAYYSQGNSGLGTKLSEALFSALNEIDQKGIISFRDFDVDKNGVIDSITFIHSGSGAEWGGVDCYDSTTENRIWSHQRADAKKWCGSEDVCMERYQIVTGLWGRCTTEIGHIGVVGHELGHFLGLLDMYDTDDKVGRGIGSFGLMGNCWGFDSSQLHPPIMDPWSKILLGWLKPTTLSQSGRYSIRAVLNTPEVYMIAEGFPPGEYLLIENRQPQGFDSDLPQGGLVIWHVDELASYNTEGFPGQSGWPGNANHYKVAVLQADGLYNLERGEGYGDGGDVWQGEGVNSLGPSTTTELGPFPNTDSYQGGYLLQTGIQIRDISMAGETMTFTLILPVSSTVKPTHSPQTATPTAAPQTTLPTSSPQTALPTRYPTKGPIVQSPSMVPTSLPTDLPTHKPTDKPSPSPTLAPSSFPTLDPSSLPTYAPSAFPTYAPTKFNLLDPIHKDLQKPVFAELPIFRIELMFSLKSSDHDIETKLLLNQTSTFIQTVLNRRYADLFGPCTVNVEKISFSSAASVPVSMTRGKATRRKESETLSTIEIKTFVTFYNGTCPQIEEMSNLLIPSFNSAVTSHGERNYSFMKYLENTNDYVISSLDYVTAVVVTHHTSITQQNGSSSSTTFSSVTWWLVALGITLPVFVILVYYMAKNRRKTTEQRRSSREATIESTTPNEAVCDASGQDVVEIESKYGAFLDASGFEMKLNESQDNLVVKTYDCSSAFLDCGTPWLAELFNFSTTGRGEAKTPLPELNFQTRISTSPRLG